MRLLLIEDDIFFRKFYAEKLKEKGYEVFEADNGDEGLKKVPEVNPDLIILDLIMPKKDGFEVLTALKNTPQYKNLPVLVFSTLGQESDIEKAKSLGASDYVNKGLFDFQSLLQKINFLASKK